jgi:hypothetical protein
LAQTVVPGGGADGCGQAGSSSDMTLGQERAWVEHRAQDARVERLEHERREENSCVRFSSTGPPRLDL